ncbi:MAG: DUF6528 family protein, partial [Bryocella sp.]
KGLPKNFVTNFRQVDDCKASVDGKELLVSSSAGAIAVVSYPAGKTVFYAHVPNAHSIETLPDGLVVAASSTNVEGNKLMFFDRAQPDKVLTTLPLKAAHGVLYDPGRKVLWALEDDVLLELSVTRRGDDVEVNEELRYPLGVKGGHDLQMMHDGSKLIVSTSGRVMMFDIAKETFAPYAPLVGLKNVKSVSINPTTGQLAYTQADPKVWWTFTVRFMQPDATATLDSETYKVRWSER